MRCVCAVCTFAQWLLDNVMCNMDSGDVEPGCVAVVVPRRAIAEGLSKFVSNMRGCTVMSMHQGFLASSDVF
jgi:hypothetical protein